MSTSRRALDAARAAIVGEAGCRDQARLLRLWSRWREAPEGAAAQAAALALQQALDASIAEVAARRARLPAAIVAEGLPISEHADAIRTALGEHRVLVVAGETGSGKTTQLPKLCLAAGRGARGMIGCTQPRRIAARAVARRVAEELGVAAGGAVGWRVRFNEQVSADTAVAFMTDGLLLAEIAGDRWLSRYDTIIVDEAHERSLNVDFLLGYLKRLLAKREDLSVVVTSATIDTARFSAFFDGAPVIEVPGRSHPVELRWRPPDGREGGSLDAVVAACDEATREAPGDDVLVFLPGEREIRDAHRALEARKYRHTVILPLYARLSAGDQDRVFHPGTGRRIVLATNVAETSLTVPRIRVVVDPGVARVKRYSARLKLDRLLLEPVSQASAAQRAGRCGRIAPGTCYRLYDEADFSARPAFTDPEIHRAALAGVILRMLALGLGRIEDFPFLDAPDERTVRDGWQQLQELGAVDARRELTATGRTMARFPVDVKLARMLVAAHAHGCLDEVLVIAAFLGLQDPRERPPDQRGTADAAHAAFADPQSEFAGILKLWAAWREAAEAMTQSPLRKWCERHFLSYLRMREWRELHRQLHLLAEEAGWPGNTAPASRESLHRALIAGLPTQIGQRDERGQYLGPRGRRMQVFPGSPLARKPPPWLLAASLLDTDAARGRGGAAWALTSAAIEPEWVIAELPHLLARKAHDPHWSRAQGRVVASEQISLFGLVLAPRRPIHYGALFPEESRQLFVAQGLVPGEINTRIPLLAKNLATLAAARDEEAKRRRAGLLVDEDWMARWYLDRLPAEVRDVPSLERWYRTLTAEARHALEWSREDLLLGPASEAERFPSYLALGDARLALRYRFEPGALDDGMTLAVPLHLLPALDATRLGWLVPGLVEEKAAALIRSLPKPLRRHVVPAPDFARAFAEAHPLPEADAFEGTLARFLSRVSGVAVRALDFDADGLPAHLVVNLCLLDRDGRHVLAESRRLDDLRERFGDAARDAFARAADADSDDASLSSFPQEVPVQITGPGGVPAYPALEDRAGHVQRVVLATRAAADAAHAVGVQRLLARAVQADAQRAARQLPASAEAGMRYAALASRGAGGGDAGALPGPVPEAVSSDPLREDLVVGAFVALCGDDLATLRSRAEFDARRERIARGLFREAAGALADAEAILAAIAGLRARLTAPLLGWARANLDDMRAQLDGLAPPRFLRGLPSARRADLPRYLKALALRAERGLRDPARDQARMLELAPFQHALAAARADGRADAEGWQTLRWELEELRVQLFAQELGVRGQVSPKRLAQRLAALSPS
jgi:ATP-dependent helicase HrpA